MLAYVSWSHLRPEQRMRSLYESVILAYHERLRNAARGVRAAIACEVVGVPWLKERSANEEWLVLEDWEALGKLAQSLKGTDIKVAYELVNHATVISSSSLYLLQRGPNNIGANYAHWFSKPEQIAYWALEDLLSDIDSSTFSLWRRPFHLGPSPEFCLLGDERFPLRGIQAWSIRRTPIHVSNALRLA